MSRLGKMNVVFLAANVVVAFVLGIAFWSRTSKNEGAAPANAVLRPDRTSPAASTRNGQNPPELGYGSIGSSSPVANSATPPSAEKVDDNPGRDWSLKSLLHGSSSLSHQDRDPGTAASGRPDAVPVAPASNVKTPPGAPPKTAPNDVRSGTIAPGVQNGPGGPQSPAPPTKTDPNPTPAPPADPTSDRTPPVVDSVSFNPPQIEDGAATMLLVNTHDDLSGVKRVTGNLRGPSGAAVISFEGQGDGTGAVFAARIAIPKQAETGNWFVANLFVTDRADNTMVATYTAATAPPGGLLRVVSSQSDSTAPEVRGASLDKVAVKDGEADVISLDVQDDVSGVATVTGVFQSPTKNAFIPFTCHQNPDSGMWDGPFSVPGNASCGEWTVQQVRVADKAGNIATVPGTAAPLARAGFLVMTEGDCDSTAPTLDGFTISPTVVSNDTATPITIIAQVHDDGTGATSVTGWAAGPVSASGQTPQISFTCTRRATDPQDTWTGSFIVPQYAARGTWKIGRIRLEDKARNIRDYYPSDPILASATFEVQ